MDCINLLEQFGRRLRIDFDPAYDPKNRPREKLDPFYMQIPCSRGVIFPFGGTELAVEVDYRPRIAGRIQCTGVCRLVQDGDEEKTFAFDVRDFEIVAAIVRPHRKRQWTDEQRAEVRHRLADYQFLSRCKASVDKTLTQSEVIG